MKPPWWAIIGAKILLSRLPVNYRQWRKLGIFRHGRMDQYEYLIKIFNKHIYRAGLMGRLKGKTILELGPGDSIGTALIAASLGAKTIFVDTGSYASECIDSYRIVAKALSDSGLNAPDLSNVNSFEDMLKACNAIYLVDGLSSFAFVESACVDFIFSQAVLEHVRKEEFELTMSECRRVLLPQGLSSHRIDLKDHIGGGLNNLRFNKRTWESDFFAKSGFYTNRIRFTQMLHLFNIAGFEAEILGVDRWQELPVAPKKLDPEFSILTEDELIISGFDVLLRPV
jgi:SAM-dependent methyltransferase